jgi:AraC-like DNA-binding protein
MLLCSNRVGSADEKKKVRFLRYPELQGSELAYIQSWQGAAPPDVKPVLEVTLVDFADKLIKYRGEPQHIRSGLVGIRSAFEIGELVARRRSETRVRMLSISDEELRNACEAARVPSGQLPTVLTYVAAPDLYRTGSAVFEAAEQHESAFALQQLIAESAAEVVRVLTGKIRSMPAAPTSAQRIRAFLHARRLDNITLDDVADEVALTRTYVAQVFKRAFHLTPLEYLMRLRVAHARELIARGSRPTDVAPLSGFYDQSHLNRWFHRVVGCTPGEYAADLFPRRVR